MGVQSLTTHIERFRYERIWWIMHGFMWIVRALLQPPNCRGGRNDTHLLAFITNKESQGCWLYKEETHHMRLLRSKCFHLLIAVSMLSVYSFGQMTTGALVGTVYDVSSAVLPGAEVVVTDTLTGISDRTVTNVRGDYTFPDLAVGVYTISFNARSFQSFKVEKVEIHVGTTIRQDATLSPGGVTTTVEVGASAPLLQTQSSDISQLVEARQITEIPLNGRDVYQLLTLAAGAQSGVAASGAATGATG